ncbi:MAG: hypothetical protein NVSMB52_14440 [Chloroflexota bacterium]
MDPAARRRKLARLEIWIAIAGLAGLVGFSRLVEASTRQYQPAAPAPDTELSRLQDHLGYSFWDTSSSKAAPPLYAQSPSQAPTGPS